MIASPARILPFIVLFSMLSACSGGGGGDASTPTSPPPSSGGGDGGGSGGGDDGGDGGGGDDSGGDDGGDDGGGTSPPPPAPAPTTASAAITAPVDGERLGAGGVLVTGVSANADMVTVTLDDGADLLVEGTERWSALVDAQTATLGVHTVTVRASGTDGDHEDTVSFEVVAGGSHTSGEQVDITYSSSVDGQQLGANLYLPPNYDAETDGPLPLVLFLHGANNDGAIAGPLLSQMSQRRWIGIGPDGRFWGVGQDPDCAWEESVAFVDSDDPDVGPGAQDMLDAVAWVRANYPVDPRRIYAVGFSMGGRGAYTIALTNPHIFAGIGAVAPASDMFDNYDRVTVSQTCLEGMMGGAPRDSAMVDTMYKITSPRFLLESAYNVPVHHAHGLDDTLSYNVAGTADQYLFGWHMTVDESWSGCHDTQMQLCFDHTPTLEELHARHPEGYDWAYLFGEGGHGNDPQFYAGGPAQGAEVGTVNPDNPSELLGIGDFLDGRVRDDAPETVVFKTYTDTDRDAFWLSLTSATPWLDMPAGVRATRDSAANAVTAELSRAEALGIDIDLAGVTIASPITLTLNELAEAAFDPALTMGAGESLAPLIVLEGDFSAASDVEVLRDGAAVSDGLISLTADGLTLGPFSIEGTTNLQVTVID